MEDLLWYDESNSTNGRYYACIAVAAFRLRWRKMARRQGAAGNGRKIATRLPLHCSRFRRNAFRRISRSW